MFWCTQYQGPIPDVTVDVAGELCADNIDDVQQQLVLGVDRLGQLPCNLDAILATGFHHDGRSRQDAVPVS